MIWSKEETLPRSEIEKIQLERLKETVLVKREILLSWSVFLQMETVQNL